MKGARPYILVGLLFLSGAAIAAYFVSIAGRKGLGDSESILVHVTFDDATGLVKRSRVVESGIDIGKLENVKLIHGKPVVTLRISKEFPLYEDASILKRSESLLTNDALLDIDPGTEGKPLIPNDGWIKIVRVAPSMDTIMATVQRISNDTEKVTGSLAGAIGNQQGQREIADILKQLNETVANVNKATAVSAKQLNIILANLQALSTDLQRLAPAQEKQIVAILDNIRQITEQTKQTIGVVHDVIQGEQGTVKDVMGEVKETVSKLDETMGSAQHIAQGVEQGQGVVGKLLRDQALADKIDHSLQGVTSYIDRLTGLKLELNMRAEIGIQPTTTPHKFDYPSMELIGMKIIPANSSRYVGVDLVSDSYGVVGHQIQVINNQALVTDTYSEALSVDAYLAQRWGPSTWRVGLIESTGGVGVDVDVVPKWLSMHVDAFNFTPANNAYPRLRAFAQFTFDKYFDIYAGGDDLINGPTPDEDPHNVLTPNGRSAFVGAGFHFTDDDLKAILSMTGVPKP